MALVNVKCAIRRVIVSVINCWKSLWRLNICTIGFLNQTKLRKCDEEPSYTVEKLRNRKHLDLFIILGKTTKIKNDNYSLSPKMITRWLKHLRRCLFDGWVCEKSTKWILIIEQIHENSIFGDFMMKYKSILVFCVILNSIIAESEDCWQFRNWNEYRFIKNWMYNVDFFSTRSS